MKNNEKNYPLLESIDNLQNPHHSMLLYEKPQYAQIVKSRYVQNGLKKGENSICFTHDNVKDIEENKRSGWLGQLCDNHHNLIYAVEPKSAVAFDCDLIK